MLDEKAAKELVVRAGLELVRSGLIARTWGNVSCRIDDSTFAITPSGRAYENLTPDDIVICKVADASFDGDVKPSSEKGIHALVYRARPNSGFVIHTHQPAASAISVIGIEKMPSHGRDFLGSGIPIAKYGLPGTKKLRTGVATALEQCTGSAIIMAHHGALCFGRDYEETFSTAQKLEAACFDFLLNAYMKKSGSSSCREEEFYNFFASSVSGVDANSQNALLLYNSRRTADGFILESEREIICSLADTNLPKEALVHKAIYQKRKDINFISQYTSGGLFSLSTANSRLLPWLDDFAQIAGRNVNCAKSVSPEHIVQALKNRMAVLVPGGGALCCAASKSDTLAIELVAEKDALAQMSAELIGGKRTLSLFDCLLMNLIYKISYSKKASM